MAHPGPTGEELIGVSREHGLLCRPLFMMRTFVGSGGIGPVLEHLAAHLEYWADMERRHVLFAAGPIMPADPSEPWSGEGTVIFRADSMTAAREVADADPMHEAGARHYEIRPWLLNHLVTADAPSGAD